MGIEIECADCISEGITTYRPPARDKKGNTVPRKRCTTHYRAWKKAAGERAHAKMVERVYGYPWGELYKELKEFQGGRCYICQRATGASKRLAHDHDHDGGLLRGLLCKTCNFDLLGRYDAAALSRALEYLYDPPAQRFLREKYPHLEHAQQGHRDHR